ncbi:SH3 domain-containing protein [Leptospira sp. 85282-16]|uniref:SH3 domain-containing protein n=1 Tax=Leptospira sp. 85282-16 TaxID=2971256 RepID=UPI0021C083E1|nr:SH3 domain-containing protein [Leptospira sp. 85282-16]MCT8335817.1 SH3 domain-containing protein [Leptospira sp. 85282-16]
MNKFAFALFSIFLFVLHTNCSLKENKTAFVNADGGLILREKPTKNSNKILLIPNNSKISIIDSPTTPDQINNKSGNWIKAKYLNNVGYIFDAYLSFEQSTVEQKLCPNSEYVIENFNSSNLLKNKEKIKSISIENAVYSEFKNSKSNNYLIAEVKNKHYTSVRKNEKIYGDFKEFNNIFISEWDDTEGDFVDSGFNLNFILNNKPNYIKFYPINKSALCYYTVVASYAYPKVENRFLKQNILSRVSYPECDFENPPENLGPDNSIELIPKKFKRDSILVINYESNMISIDEYCDKEINDEIYKLWENAKSLNIKKL